jgi:hypothetical protein
VPQLLADDVQYEGTDCVCSAVTLLRGIADVLEDRIAIILWVDMKTVWRRNKTDLEDQGVDGIEMDLREIGWGGVEWIHLAQDRDRWRAVVNAVMNLRVLAPRI